MNDPFLGGIYPAGFNFAPNGLQFCSGQTRAISANPAPFSLLGAAINIAQPYIDVNYFVAAGIFPFRN